MVVNHIAAMKYRHYQERDREQGEPDTPERRRFNRDCAEDFADQMEMDALDEARDAEHKQFYDDETDDRDEWELGKDD